MKIKYLSNLVTVDLDKSAEVWSNGRCGDARVTLWADEGAAHVWAETNGDPVYGEDELRACLLTEGMDPATVEAVLIGDLTGLA